MTRDEQIAAILSFWFGPCALDPSRIPERQALWFSSDGDTDAEIASRFSGLVADARAGALGRWHEIIEGQLALIILLDQFPRNIFRGAPSAFASDDCALDICQHCIDDGSLLALPPIQQAFLLMPLQHAESLDVQQRSVQEFEKLSDRVAPSVSHHFEGFLNYARLHYEIIERFGRFPHRNAILGRSNTEQENNYLAGDAPRFGQH